MANTINLGSYPTGEGTTNEERSIYIGNNRFVRILSQSNPSRTIAVLSESTDVFSGTQTLTNVHEQVIITNDKILRYKMKLLSNGDVLIIGNRESTLGSYVNSAITLRFNDVTTQFEIISDYNISQGDPEIYNMTRHNFELYNDDAIVLHGQYSTYYAAFIIKGVTSGTLTKTRVVFDSTADSFYNARSTYSKVIDDKVFFSIGSETSYQGWMVNMTSETLLMNRATYYNAAIKLDTDRYVSIVVDHNAYLKYQLEPTSPATNVDLNSSVLFTPIVDLGAAADDDRTCDIVPLDRQHLIYFYRHQNSDSIYASFLKIIDENYGFVADNSQVGNATTGSGIFVCNITTSDLNIDNYHTGRLVHPISANQFWIQTDTNQFTFLTMTAS